MGDPERVLLHHQNCGRDRCSAWVYLQVHLDATSAPLVLAELFNERNSKAYMVVPRDLCTHREWLICLRVHRF